MRHTWISCLIIATLLFPIQAAGKLHKTMADSLYQVAQSLPDTVSVQDRINALKEVTKTDPHYAPAYHQLGQLYLSLKTINDRQRAERAIDQALKINPQNIAYQLTQGDLLWEQGHRYQAEKHYERVLKQHPKNVQVAYALGRQALRDFLINHGKENYDFLVNPIEAGVVVGVPARFSWKPFAKQNMDRALRYLNQCIDLDPHFKNAYYQLGLAHFERGKPNDLVHTMKRLLEYDANDVSANLYCALGYQRLGHHDNAHTYYSRALEHMSPKERFIMEDYEAVSGVPLTTAADMRAFWHPQDPLMLTPFNERHLTHYGRVAYANLRFGNPEKNILGSQTDMGKTHIKFGRYLHRRIFYRHSRKEPPSQTWFYEDFRISFRYVANEDGWIFDWKYDLLPMANMVIRSPWDLILAGDAPGARRAVEAKSKMHPVRTVHQAEDAIYKEEPARYIDPYAKRKYTLPHLATAFQERDGVRLELACAVPLYKLKPLETDHQAHLEHGIFLFNPNWKSVYQKPQYNTVPCRQPSTQNRQSFALLKHTLYVPPGQYTLIAEVMDRGSKSIGTFREQRTFASHDSSFALSDLLLASNITPQALFPEKRTDLDITPNPVRTTTQDASLFIYLELYNLTPDAFGQTQYEIAYHVGPPSGPIDPTLFDAQDLADTQARTVLERQSLATTRRDTLPEQSPTYQVRYILPKRHVTHQYAPAQTTRTAIAAQYQGNQTNDFTFLEIDVSKLPKGIHKLTVTATDKHTDLRTDKYILFRVVEG